jgi:hypothetical protein
MGLPLQMPDRLCHRIQGFIGSVPQKKGPFPQQFFHKTVHGFLLLGEALFCDFGEYFYEIGGGIWKCVFFLGGDHSVSYFFIFRKCYSLGNLGVNML